MKVQGFNHVTIDVSDLERSLTFYTQVLGMRLVHKARHDAYLEWGMAWVCLQERPALPKPRPQLGVNHVAFSIAPDDFHEAVAVLRSHGVPIVRGPVQRGAGWTVNFLDPDGMQLELHTSNLAARMAVWT
ncbi:glutathione transferase FosA [Alicyclobacillus cellulosilyticus]|uniref:Glutathione transferase FosA n=1 Tax=Alicyclobacillus cellulosilyticus TaxID=1003997 RepID=A0A917KCZ7_9BACL|nr:VOC family protein [Alicyclobacillus cellulosilyticus]GGJ09657.1 glutathione transferase FosA [Alicyclobacillus cellulosilyticus]